MTECFTEGLSVLWNALNSSLESGLKRALLLLVFFIGMAYIKVSLKMQNICLRPGHLITTVFMYEESKTPISRL